MLALRPVLRPAAFGMLGRHSTLPCTARYASTLQWSTVQTLQASEKVVAFTKSYCPTCRDLMERFDDANVNVKDVQLDKYENGNAIRDELRKVTGQEHVPFVYVNGKLVPSDILLPGMKASGGKEAAMKAELTKAGVQVTGYFRP